MNILVAINKAYIRQLNILLNSIQFSNLGESFDIFVLHKELDKTDKLLLEKNLNTKKIKINMIKIEEEDIYFRLFASKYLPKNIDRILYLDADTVVINKLNELYEMDFGENLYIATTHVKKIMHKFQEVRLNIDEDVPYINSGVMLLNLSEMRKIDIENDIKEFVQKNRRILSDKDIVTSLYGNKIKLVDSMKYNLGDKELNFYNLNHHKNPIGLKWVLKNTVVIHYYGKNKPWDKDYVGKLGSIYLKLERKLRNSGKVLVLSCGTGGGHNSAAKAVQEALENKGIKADFMEYLDIINSGVKDTVNKMYLKTTNREGKTFKVVYKLGELYQKTNLKSPVYGLNHLNKDKLYKYIKENDYEFIVTTHLFAAQVLTAIKKEHHIKFIAVATDYVCIPFWKETNPDYFVIPNESLKNDFVQKGVKENKLYPLGIPTKKVFSEKYDKNECKKILNLDLNKKHIVVLTGSMGFGNVEEMVKKLSDNIENTNIIVACGTNEELKEKIKINDRIIPVSYTNNIDLYMKSGDIILSKPGGLTSTEIAILGKPFIHTIPIPGCENYNANFFDKNNMSIKCLNINEVVENTKSLLNNIEKQKEQIENQAKYINKNSADDIADLIKKEIKIRNEKWKKKLTLQIQ